MHQSNNLTTIQHSFCTYSMQGRWAWWRNKMHKRELMVKDKEVIIVIAKSQWVLLTLTTLWCWINSAILQRSNWGTEKIKTYPYLESWWGTELRNKASSLEAGPTTPPAPITIHTRGKEGQRTSWGHRGRKTNLVWGVNWRRGYQMGNEKMGWVKTMV